MKQAKLSEMVKGWFVGSFQPTAYTTTACEVAVKSYTAGDYEADHYHKIATEITLILHGKAKMLSKEWNEGDIIVVEPGESTNFTALTNVTTVVVKVPGVINDKFSK